MPPGFADDFEPNEQKAMLVHELAHLAGRDPTWQQVVNLLCVVMRWGPRVVTDDVHELVEEKRR